MEAPFGRRKAAGQANPPGDRPRADARPSGRKAAQLHCREKPLRRARGARTANGHT